MDNVFLGIYILELQLKLYVHRGQFFASGWNNFGPLPLIADLATRIKAAMLQRYGQWGG
jgi:hypothetical protein